MSPNLLKTMSMGLKSSSMWEPWWPNTLSIYTHARVDILFWFCSDTTLGKKEALCKTYKWRVQVLDNWRHYTKLRHGSDTLRASNCEGHQQLSECHGESRGLMYAGMENQYPFNILAYLNCFCSWCLFWSADAELCALYHFVVCTGI